MKITLKQGAVLLAVAGIVANLFFFDALASLLVDSALGKRDPRLKESGEHAFDADLAAGFCPVEESAWPYRIALRHVVRGALDRELFRFEEAGAYLGVDLARPAGYERTLISRCVFLVANATTPWLLEGVGDAYYRSSDAYKLNVISLCWYIVSHRQDYDLTRREAIVRRAVVELKKILATEKADRHLSYCLAALRDLQARHPDLF